MPYFVILCQAFFKNFLSFFANFFNINFVVKHLVPAIQYYIIMHFLKNFYVKYIFRFKNSKSKWYIFLNIKIVLDFLLQKIICIFQKNRQGLKWNIGKCFELSLSLHFAFLKANYQVLFLQYGLHSKTNFYNLYNTSPRQ